MKCTVVLQPLVWCLIRKNSYKVMFFTLIYRKKGKEKIIGKSTNTTTTQLLYSLKNDQIVESTHL